MSEDDKYFINSLREALGQAPLPFSVHEGYAKEHSTNSVTAHMQLHTGDGCGRGGSYLMEIQ
jgi:hypothetical protein